MADRIPLVLAGGEPQRLQSADNLVINGVKAFASGGLNIGGVTDPGAGNATATKQLRAEGFSLFTSGAGVEIKYGDVLGTGTLYGNIITYDRSAAAYHALIVDALDQRFYISGTERMRLQAGLNIGGTPDPGAGNVWVSGELQLSTNNARLRLQRADDNYIDFNNSYLLRFRSISPTDTGAAVRMILGAGLNIGGVTDPGAGNLACNDLPVSRVLASVTGINAKTAADTALYTVPTGKSLVITSIIVRCTAATSISAPASASIITGAAVQLWPNRSLTGITVASAMYTFTPDNTWNIVLATGTSVLFRVGTGATGTSQTFDVDLLGYLL